NFRNPYYHTINDTVAKLDFGFMSNIVRATVATLAEVADVRHAGAAQGAIRLPQKVVVPSLVDQKLTAAVSTLAALGLTHELTVQFSDSIPADAVISQDPVAGTQVFVGSSVALVVSLGAEPQPPV